MRFGNLRQYKRDLYFVVFNKIRTTIIGRAIVFYKLCRVELHFSINSPLAHRFSFAVQKPRRVGPRKRKRKILIQNLIDIVLLAGFIAKLSVEQHSFAQESTKLAKGFRRKQVNI